MKEEINLQNLSHQLDESLRSRAAIGLVVLATDHVIENEFRKILNLQGVALYQSRIFNEPSVNTETLSCNGKQVGEFRQADSPWDAFGCGCFWLYLRVDGDRSLPDP